MTRTPRLTESVMFGWVRPFLEAAGYSVYASPDGADYFDVVAVRGEEVGLIELKVADWRRVVTQAVDRRDWSDWVAIALPRASLAHLALARTREGPGRRIGIWVTRPDGVDVLRLASASGVSAPGTVPQWRRRLKELIGDTTELSLPGAVRWSVRRPDGRPGGWRLEEFDPEGVAVDAGSPPREEERPSAAARKVSSRRPAGRRARTARPSSRS